MQKTTKKVQNKQNNETKQNIIEFVRWVLLGPAVCAAWWSGLVISTFLERWGLFLDLLDSYPIVYFFIVFVIIPVIAMFFVAKGIAPKYKKISGVVAVVVCILWDLFLFLNLMMYGIAG